MHGNDRQSHSNFHTAQSRGTTFWLWSNLVRQTNTSGSRWPHPVTWLLCMYKFDPHVKSQNNTINDNDFEYFSLTIRLKVTPSGDVTSCIGFRLILQRGQACRPCIVSEIDRLVEPQKCNVVFFGDVVVIRVCVGCERGFVMVRGRWGQQQVAKCCSGHKTTEGDEKNLNYKIRDFLEEQKTINTYTE